MSRTISRLDACISLVSMVVFMTIGGILLQSASLNSFVMQVLCAAVALCALVEAITFLIINNTYLEEGELNV